MEQTEPLIRTKFRLSFTRPELVSRCIDWKHGAVGAVRGNDSVSVWMFNFENDELAK